MAVTVVTRADQDKAQGEALGRGRFLVTERLCRTRDGRIVLEDACFDGGNLAYMPGQEIPMEEARAVGLIPEVQATPLVAEIQPGELTAVTPVPAPTARAKGK